MLGYWWSNYWAKNDSELLVVLMFMIFLDLRGSNAIFFVYDVTCEESFDNLSNWMKFVKEVFNSSTKKPFFVLLGNKSMYELIYC
jgi:hypothetical protein